jgi:lysophospholipase L1-like esterase
MLNRPSRELYLLGFCAEPNTIVDDTPINSQGFTGHVLAPSKPRNTIRVLTLGGSAMFNRRISERLIESLSGLTSARIELQGGALRTHTTRSSLIKYNDYFSKYSFDYVLIYHGINDLWMNHVDRSDFKDDYSHNLPFYKRNAVLNNSCIARLIYNRFLWRKPEYAYNGSNFASCQSFEHNIRELVERVRKDRGYPILMTFAWHIPEDYTRQLFVEGKLDYNNSERYDACSVELWGNVDYVQEGLQRNNQIIRMIAQEERVMLIDIEGRGSFQSNPRNFGDVCHFSEEGTSLFVQLITEVFASNMLLPEN